MNKEKQKFDIYQETTNRIIELLESHEAGKYQRTWFSASSEIFASNPTSKASYNGLNQLLLSFVINLKGFTQNRWMTLKQGNAIGAKVKKGERSTPISFYSPKYVEKETGNNVTKQVKELLKKGQPVPENVKVVPILKHYLVFNIEQFENMPEEMFFKGQKLEFLEPQKNDLAEEVLRESGAKIIYKTFSDTAFTMLTGQTGNFYSPKKDTITLAERKQFKDSDSFYSVAFHELGHWTGHPTRFNRDLSGKFGSKEYALEELTAELFSAFLSARLGFNTQNHKQCSIHKKLAQMPRG
jgi:antirestriction protein ArdC